MNWRRWLITLCCLAPPATAQLEIPSWSKGYQLELDASGVTFAFGAATAVDGDLAAVGQTYVDSLGPITTGIGAGQALVHVFRESGGTWPEEATLSASLGHLGDGYASRLAVQGDRIVVGAPETTVTTSGQGVVYVYLFDGANWVEEAALVGPDEVDFAFGTSVALHRRELVVGGDQVRVYERFGSTWALKAELAATGDAAFDGRTIMTLDTAAREAQFFERSPEVRIQGGTQTPLGPIFTDPSTRGGWELVASVAPPVDTGFGWAFRHPAIDGDVAALGAYPTITFVATDNPGQVAVLERSRGTWEARQVLEPVEGGSYRFFGAAISIDGDVMLVGAPAEATLGLFTQPIQNQPGAVYEYHRTGALPLQPWELARRYEPRFDEALQPTVLHSDPAGGVFMVNYVGSFKLDSVSRVAPGGVQLDVLLEYDPVQLGADRPVALATGANGELYVANRDSNNVLEIDGPVLQEIIDVSGDSMGNELNNPVDLAVGFGGAVFVAGATSQNVHKITPTGTITEIIDSTGDGVTALGAPQQLDIFPTGALIVAGDQNVFSVNQVGTIDLLFRPANIEPDSYDTTSGMATDSTGNIFVSGRDSHNVVEIRSPEIAQVVLDETTVFRPSTLRVDAADNLYVACQTPGSQLPQVLKRTPEGSVSVVLDNTGNGVADLGILNDIAVSPDGTLYAGTIFDTDPGSIFGQVALEGRLFEVQPDGTTTLILSGLHHIGNIQDRRFGTSVSVDADVAIVSADEISYNHGYPGYSGYDQSGRGAAYVYDVSQPTELLVIGDGPGRSSFVGSSHEFTTQVGPLVEDAWPRDPTTRLEFVLPDPDDPEATSLVPDWMLDGRFAVQLLSWDPEGHPSQPERWSHGLSVTVTPDGQVHTKAFGAPQGDLSLRVEVTRNAAGQRVMRFPYTSAP